VSASSFINDIQVRRLLGFVDLSEYSGESSIELSEAALKVLYMSVICEDVAVTKNQNLVLSILLKDSTIIGRIADFVVTVAGTRNAAVHGAVRGSSTPAYHGTTPKHEEDEDEDEDGHRRQSDSTNWYEDGLKDVFARVFDLLAGCCFGRNHYTETQARSLLSANDLLTLLSDAQAYAQWTLANSVQNFLNMAFLDVTVQSDRFGQSSAAWELLRLNCQVLQVITTSEIKAQGNHPNVKLHGGGGGGSDGLAPGSHLASFDPAEDFYLYHYIHGAVIPSTEELFLHYITEIDANSSKIAFRHNDDNESSVGGGGGGMNKSSFNHSLRGSNGSLRDSMGGGGGGRFLDMSQGDTSRRKQCVDLLTAIFTLHKCKRHWRAASKSTWSDLNVAEGLSVGISTTNNSFMGDGGGGANSSASQRRASATKRNSDRIVRQANRRGGHVSATSSSDNNSQPSAKNPLKSRLSVEEEKATERSVKQKDAEAELKLWKRRDILMHQGRALHVMHMILNAAALSPELYPLLDGLSAYMFRNSKIMREKEIYAYFVIPQYAKL
jgi:hypothetical protein